MYYDGKIYELSNLSKEDTILYDAVCEEEMAKIHNPLEEFVATLGFLSEAERCAAISSFIAAGRDKRYPDYLKLYIQNTLPMVKYLAKRMIRDMDFDITEENKEYILQQICYHNNDPDMEKILEIRGMRNEGK